MALNPKLTNAAVSAAADAVCALANGGYLELYDGTQPATGDTAIAAQVNLATLTFGSPAFAGAVNGVAAANAIGDDADANQTGIAAWFRVFKTGHTPGSGDEALLRVFDGSIGTATSNLILNSVNIQQHARVSVTSFQYTQPKG
jgi:hypothetical protein